MRTHTLSIVARDASQGLFGAALCASLPAAGAFCIDARAGTGACAVQGAVNPLLRRRLLDALADGADAEGALETVLDRDRGRDGRQIALVAANGRSSAWTGDGVRGYAGQRTGDGYAIVGSHLRTDDVLDVMEAAFRDAPEAALSLPERLLRAVEAGVAAGGDSRGHKSAALLVAAVDGYPFVDLRVDESVDPVDELRRIHDLEAARFMPGYELWVESLRDSPA